MKDGNQASGAEQGLELWQDLPSAIPPLVHSLNNSLTVLAGVLEVSPSDMAPLARDEVERMRLALGHLSRLAKFSSPRTELFDLGSGLEAVESLLNPLAASLGVQLEIPSTAVTTVLRGDPDRFPGNLVSIVLAELLAMRDAGLGRSGATRDPTRALCRLRLLRRRGHAVLSISRTLGPDEDPGGSVRLFEGSSLPGAAIDFRALGRALSYRLDLSDCVVGAEPKASGETEGRLVLAGADEEEGGTIASFLGGEGYEVHRLDRIPTCAHLGSLRADLILIEMPLAAASPLEMQALRNDPSLRDSILLLGGVSSRGSSTPTSWAGLGTLPHPFRPDELLDAIRGRVGRDSATPPGT